MSPAVPAVNDLVTVVTASGRVLQARVEDVAPDALAVARTLGAGTAQDLAAPGDPLEVHWTCARGLAVLPVVLRDRSLDGVPLWWLVPTGPVEVHQRRSYVRSAVVGDWPVHVAVTWVLPEDGTAEGCLVDLGEGGLRARLRHWAAPEGAAVAVRLTLAEGTGWSTGSSSGAAPADRGGGAVRVTEFELLGTAVRAQDQPDAGTSTDLTEVVVQLHDAGGDADRLRALVFAWQRAARRS